jgi:hypothetical protein
MSGGPYPGILDAVRRIVSPTTLMSDDARVEVVVAVAVVVEVVGIKIATVGVATGATRILLDGMMVLILSSLTIPWRSPVSDADTCWIHIRRS